MAQMYARVQPRALFFTMDHAPEPEFELAPASRETALSPVVRSSDGAPSIQAPSPSLGGEGRERGLGVPVRMHWLAGARRLAGKPAPTFMLDAEEVQRQIAALLKGFRFGAGTGLPLHRCGQPNRRAGEFVAGIPPVFAIAGECRHHRFHAG